MQEAVVEAAVGVGAHGKRMDGRNDEIVEMVRIEGNLIDCWCVLDEAATVLKRDRIACLLRLVAAGNTIVPGDAGSIVLCGSKRRRSTQDGLVAG